MKAVVVMFDTLSRRFLSTYGNTWVKTPNFERLKQKSVQFENFYAGSLPCMPARRELHTGRYNFLHRSWGPMEPCDFSCFEALKKQGVYTHIVTDHSHYWEDGGSTYLPRYSSWEGFRGQEGDRYVGMVNAQNRLSIPKQAKTTKMGESFYVNHANRLKVDNEEDFSSVQTFQAGIEFLVLNHQEDKWCLQIEAFDPHEPFFVPQRYLDMYETVCDEVVFEWPAYAPVVECEEEKKQIMIRYAALITMCDEYLGKVLDAFDTYQLWEDTMLIVNTDHGFLMGEHDWWGKNMQPPYQEVVHLPFYYYDPRYKDASGTRNALSQTIDIPATLLSYFDCEKPDTMLGNDLSKVLQNDKNHEVILYGSHGGHVSVCDTQYIYMRSSIFRNNKPLFDYTLMPTKMRGFLGEKDIKQSILDNHFKCFHHYPMLKIPSHSMMSSYRFGNKLFDIKNDPLQKTHIEDAEIELNMLEKMRQLMIENEAPQEQYERLGIVRNKKMKVSDLHEQKLQKEKQDELTLPFTTTPLEKQQILFVRDLLATTMYDKFYEYLEQSYGKVPLLSLLSSYLRDELKGIIPSGFLPLFLSQLTYAYKHE